jgi:transposase
MSRPLNVRKPSTAEMRKLQTLIDDLTEAKQRRRAHAMLLHGVGVGGEAIAQGLSAHSNTIYADLHAFAAEGVAAVYRFGRVGSPKAIPPAQEAEICQLADHAPIDIGLPYARWSLTKLRAYLLQRRWVKHLSREHLRRILQKGGCAVVASSANWSVMTHNASLSWRGSAAFSGICPQTVSCCSLT